MHRIHLGPLLLGYHTNQLQSCRSKFSWCYLRITVLYKCVQVNFFVGSTGLMQLGRLAQ